MELLILVPVFLAGGVVGALIAHRLRKEKPEVYDQINDEAKKL